MEDGCADLIKLYPAAGLPPVIWNNKIEIMNIPVQAVRTERERGAPKGCHLLPGTMATLMRNYPI